MIAVFTGVTGCGSRAHDGFGPRPLPLGVRVSQVELTHSDLFEECAGQTFARNIGEVRRQVGG